MKKIILGLFFVTLGLSAQTTDVEYNYLTKGYKETVEKGLDLKQGYELQDLYFHNEVLYDFYFKLFNDSSTKKTKALLVVAHSKTWGNWYYLCIPLDNTELYKRYEKELNSWDSAILSSYSSALSKILAVSLTAE